MDGVKQSIHNQRSQRLQKISRVIFSYFCDVFLRLSTEQYRCLFSGFPLAAVTCMPATSASTMAGGIFNLSTIHFIDCGITLTDVANSTIQDLPTIAVLTSRPEILSETQISEVSETLNLYLKELQKEVDYIQSYLHFLCIDNCYKLFTHYCGL